MNYNIITTPYFDKQFKKISKKHHSLPEDFKTLLDELEKNPFYGTRIIEDCYKIRLAITSKGKGKSGGARVITYFYKTHETLFLLSIYDKSEQNNISNKELQLLIENLKTNF